MHLHWAFSCCVCMCKNSWIMLLFHSHSRRRTVDKLSSHTHTFVLLRAAMMPQMAVAMSNWRVIDTYGLSNLQLKSQTSNEMNGSRNAYKYTAAYCTRSEMHTAVSRWNAYRVAFKVIFAVLAHIKVHANGIWQKCLCGFAFVNIILMELSIFKNVIPRWCHVMYDIHT